MVEGGAVDWAAHANNMDQMIGEQIDFYNAVQAVLEWVNDPANDSSWVNTLVIITADHETGYLTANLDTFPDVPLGNLVNDTTLALEKIYLGSGGRRASWDDIDVDGDIDPNETVYWVWNTGSHSNSLVPLYSRGPGADLFAHFIAGNDTIRGDYVDNTDVYTVMDMVLGVSDGCLGDFDSDGDVDGSDLAFFAADGDVAVFAADFGRTDCPCLSLTAESKPTFY
jgi:alkaline phosphatase